MKKNASFITIDSSSIKWLIEKMSQVPNDSLHSLKELKDELSELLQGETSSLILNTDELDEDYTVSANVLKFNELEINAKNRTVQESGRAIVLTPKEFEILYFLAQNQGTVFTKEQIYNAVWDEDYFLSDSNIMAFIRKLRKKIEPNPDEPIYIITIWGVGYKFNDNL